MVEELLIFSLVTPMELTPHMVGTRLSVPGIDLPMSWASHPNFPTCIAILLTEDYDKWAPLLHAAIDSWPSEEVAPVLFALMEGRRQEVESMTQTVLADPTFARLELVSDATEALRDQYALMASVGADAVRRERAPLIRDSLTDLLNQIYAAGRQLRDKEPKRSSPPAF